MGAGWEVAVTDIHHITDLERRDGDWTLCGLPLPPYAVRSTQPVICKECEPRLRELMRGPARGGEDEPLWAGR